MTKPEQTESVAYSGGINPAVTIRRCSWGACGQCQTCKARAAGRRAVNKHADALERLADS